STSPDRAGLRRELRAIRKRGFAESRGELFPGGGALAAPIKDFSGRTVGVMDILTPEHRYTAEHRERCIGLLLEGAAHASQRLGFRAQEPGGPAAPAPKRRPRSASPAGARRLPFDRADERGHRRRARRTARARAYLQTSLRLATADRRQVPNCLRSTLAHCCRRWALHSLRRPRTSANLASVTRQ